MKKINIHFIFLSVSFLILVTGILLQMDNPYRQQVGVETKIRSHLPQKLQRAGDLMFFQDTEDPNCLVCAKSFNSVSSFEDMEFFYQKILGKHR